MAATVDVTRTESMQIEEEYAALNKALTLLWQEYTHKHQKIRKTKFSSVGIDELQEFNLLRYQNQKAGMPNASVAASSSNRCLSYRTKLKFTSSTGHARRIRYQAQQKFNTLHKFSQGKGGKHASALDNRVIFTDLLQWAASQKPGLVTPVSFHRHACDEVLPKHSQKPITVKTAKRWMHKLGFQPTLHKKTIYYDGHERKDVVEARKSFVITVADLQMFSKQYDGKDCEVCLPVDPEVLGHNKETVFIYHDKSTIHAKERPQLIWLLPGSSELRSKSDSRLIHISDFILEFTGRLVLSNEQAASANLTVTNAATVIYPGLKGDPWWDMPQLCEQIFKKALPIFNALHPDSQAVFVFDCSSAHKAYGPEYEPISWRQTNDDDNIPNHLRGQPQSMCYPSEYPDPSLASQPKGVQAVLKERGLWDHYGRL
ncbi:hypothetical protein PSTG_06598 [Puccinia striiformis f. sp. tritici PST-78]|uniref:DDE-1 domain-containing protein n=1 Tax=Puccinia striiformis f. sp. tritici PST-78 TaxID=1165861 RepID=A0A0L0VLM4_9BASI|nr:hypothetical protein PSTG_06598 [Puccinia striiformis f. sp. tritici PST-78]